MISGGGAGGDGVGGVVVDGDGVADAIADAIAKGRTVVFPSEVAAQYWRHRVLLDGHRRCLWEDRVLAWDTFKRRYLREARGVREAREAQEARGAREVREAPGAREGGGYDDRQPASAITRLLFAATLDGSRRELQPLYRQLSSVGDSPIAISKIAALLPKIVHLVAHERIVADASFHHALCVLDLEYRDYLRAAHLYEALAAPADAACAAPADVAPEESLVICFPQLIPEFPLVAARFGRSAVDTIAVPDHYGALRATSYPAINDELVAVATEIRRLLLDGVDSADIAVTVAQLGELRNMVESVFTLYQLPFCFHKSRVLAEYPFGTLLRLFSRALRYDFSYRVLLELVAHPHLTWNTNAKQALAIDARRLMSGDGGGNFGRMYHAFPAPLYQAISDIVEVDTFDLLCVKLAQFVSAYMDIEAWSAAQRRAYKYALELLQRLAAEARRTGRSVSDPFGFYLMILQQSNYTPTAHLAEIGIYDYPISGGICPPYHFLFNMAQHAVSHARTNWEMFSDHARQRYGLREDNITTPILRLYSHSGARVYCSYSQESPLGTASPSALFFEGRVDAPGIDADIDADIDAAANVDGIADADTDAAANIDGIANTDAAANSATDAVAAASTDAAFVLPMHRRGARNYLRHNTSAVANRFNRAAIASPAVGEMVRRALLLSDGTARISYSALAVCMVCSYRFYVERALGVVEHPHQYIDDTERRMGVLQHRVMRALFSAVREREAPLGRADTVIDVRRCVADALAENEFLFSALERRLIFATVSEQCPRAFAAVAERYAHCLVDAVEQDYTVATERGYTLVGKIDLLLRDADSKHYAVIDYKRKKRHESARELPKEMQLAFYSEMLAQSGLNVAAAQYYFFEQNLLHRGLGALDMSPAPPPADNSAISLSAALSSPNAPPNPNAPPIPAPPILYDEQRHAIRLACLELTQRIHEGDFSLPPSAAACSACVHPQLCRSAFTI